MAVLSLAAILILTFAFGYLNGLNGAGSIVATMISTRALKPSTAKLLTILCLCIGPFIFGLAVTGSISVNLVRWYAVTTPVMIAALAGAVGWIGFAAWLKIPCSATQAFIGSLVGAVWAGFGAQAIIADGVLRSMAALFLSPVLGIVAGYFIVKLSYRASLTATPRVNRWFRNAQVPMSLLVALSFGSNDGQKLMGILALGLAATSGSDYSVPYWAAAFSAVAMAVGTMVGSQRVSHKLGKQLCSVQPIHGFGAQTASGIVIFSASLLGSPVSGSQVIASAIVGAGSAERLRHVRWGEFRQILRAWLFTIPLSALVGAVVYLLMHGLFT
ncbi:MAG: inorganic phosphate transporter [Chloroflexi bacterium]|nr:inorganic phosphate transporter [Chloroflexota bacterium]